MTRQFGTFEFDDTSLELRRNGRLVPIEPQPARALALLLRRAPEVVTRDEMRLVVWGPDTHVDFDRGLAYCLSAIRQALGDKGENPRFVQTLPKRGYCVIAPVRVVDRDPAPAASDAAAVAAPPASAALPPAEAPPEPRAILTRRHWLLGTGALVSVTGLTWMALGRGETQATTVIAVSVFDNETGDAGYDRVVANLSDTVVAHLTPLEPARVEVIGNAEVLRRPRNIRNLTTLASALRADFVLLGQLQRTDAGLRFITHFIRLPEQTHLRAQRLTVSEGDDAALERAVLAEFERCVRMYVLASD